MNKRIYKLIFFAFALFVYTTATAQTNLAVESFTKDETDQEARITSPHRDQNDKVCAIVKIETPLLLQDFTFDAGMIAVGHSEQKTGEIWLWLSPGTLRLTIIHKYLGTVRNYAFGEALKEATVYIMKLKSGKVTTIIEENTTQQYFEITCAAEGATIKIDDAAPELFIDGKFRRLLLYGKHKYTVEAPMYHPESGITEITEQKAAPISVVLKPKFGKLSVNTQPEQGADVFIDDEKKGQSPLTVERIGSGQHTIRAVKSQFRPVTQEITITDGATELISLTMPANFAVITLTTPDGGDIYIDDEKKATARWNGRLTPGQYKVELRKPSHRPSVKAIEITAGIDKTIQLEAPTPIYGSLDIQANTEAIISIDGIQQNTTPYFINKLLIGKHEIKLQADGYVPYTQTVDILEGKTFELNAILQKKGSLRITANVSSKVTMDGKQIGYTPITVDNLSAGRYKIDLQASGYKPYTQTVDIQDGKMSELNAILQEEDKTGSLHISANISAKAYIDGKYVGNTPITIDNLSVGKKKVSFEPYNSYYRRRTKPVTVIPGNTEVYGKLKEKADAVWLLEYRNSFIGEFLGFSVGYCKKWGGYIQGTTFLFLDGTATAGCMLQATKFMFVHGGAGYSTDAEAPLLEFGITFKMRRFAMTVGHYFPLRPGWEYKENWYYCWNFGLGGFIER
ncbi:MAG: PEGA domain-containing protein [Bacteroidales bacterium]|jgi:hypothetical protein|nr:PEGA domain-containing protein [Bacteroidales bacterium]